MNFIQRIEGVFSNPQKTFQALAERPVWVDVLVIILVVLAVFSYAIQPILQKETIQLYRDNVKLQERMGEENYNRWLARQENPSRSSIIIRAFLLSPLTQTLGFLLSALIILVLGRLFSTNGNFLLVFAALLHANLIDKLLGTAVRAVAIFLKKSVMQTTTSLAVLFPKLEFTSPSYILLSQLDFFQLWMFGVLGYGLSAVFKVELKKGLIISYGFWLLKTLVYVGVGFLGRSFLS